MKSFQKHYFFLLLLIFFATTTFCNARRSKKRKTADQICSCRMKGKIIGGEETEKNEFPWHVGFIDPNYNVSVCGGVLVNDLFVISAAHCLKHVSCKDVDFLVGAHDFTHMIPGTQKIKAEYCNMHPDFDSSSLLNDIGIIKLAEKVQYDDKKSPACFPESGTDYTGRTATVIGWGKINENITGYSRVLLKTNITIADTNECVWKHDIRKEASSIICSTWDVEGKDACNGDSGGALMVFDKRKKHYVIGLVSYGTGCGRKLPAVYTRVDRHYKWIEEYTGKKGFCGGFNV